MPLKIVSINLGNFGSTGRIMYGISDMAEKNGHNCWCFYPERKENVNKRNNDFFCCSSFSYKLNRKLAYLTGNNGGFNIFSTFKTINKINKGSRHERSKIIKSANIT